MKILQLSCLELAEYIDTELQNNPLLELDNEQTDKEPDAQEIAEQNEDAAEYLSEKDKILEKSKNTSTLPRP